MRHRLWSLASVFLCLCLTLGLCACAPAAQSPSASPSPTAAQPSPSQTAQDAGDAEDAEDVQGLMSSFAATDLDGQSVDQGIFSGYALTMVNVWATFCGPCIQEMPDLGELAAEYQDKGVRIVGLVSDVLDADGNLSQDQVETAREIVESTGANYLHLLPSQDLFGLLGQITAVPTTFFVDERGVQVGYAYMGSMSKEQWSQILDEMLEEVAP